MTQEIESTAGPRSLPPTSPSALGDLPREEFDRAAREAIDWIGSYLAAPERYSVLARVAPGAVRASLPATPPQSAEPLSAILSDFRSALLPGITHWNHPGFFAYFAISASAPGILAELLSAALNVNGMLWRTSPTATELEELTLDWLRQMMGLGAGWFGMINDTASISTFLALAAAREVHPELEVRKRGLSGRADLPTLRVYCSEQAHSSVDKAVIALGLGHDNAVKIGCDGGFRMRPELLADAMRRDQKAGMLPIAVVATVGTTSTTSVDPVPAIADICARRGVWLHVDAAYGGAAAICPEMRHVLDGVDAADSLVVNPHKWLFTPVDCSAFYTRRPDVLKRAFALVPEYLTTQGDETVVNFMDYGVQLGRRFRALKLWMVIRAFGAEGLAARVREHCRLAREFGDWVRATDEWELVAPIPMGLVCFRWAPRGVTDVDRDVLNERLLAAVNESGQVYLSHTRLAGRYVLRLAIGNLRTEMSHVAQSWALLRDAAATLRSHVS
ncbi:MAG: pyridoxal-dependent decarboxylase [Gemmatimonadaceae bacterium]